MRHDRTDAALGNSCFELATRTNAGLMVPETKRARDCSQGRSGRTVLTIPSAPAAPRSVTSRSHRRTSHHMRSGASGSVQRRGSSSNLMSHWLSSRLGGTRRRAKSKRKFGKRSPHFAAQRLHREHSPKPDRVTRTTASSQQEPTDEEYCSPKRFSKR